MPQKIERLNSVSGSITATNSAATSPKIPFGAVSGGMLHVSAVSSATTITWHAAFGQEETPVPVNADGSGTVANGFEVSQSLSDFADSYYVSTIAGAGIVGSADGTGDFVQFNYPQVGSAASGI